MNEAISADAASIVISEDGIQCRTLKEWTDYARLLLQSGYAGSHKTTAAVIATLQYGRLLGIKDIPALNGIAVINGRPTVWGDLMLAIAVAHPLCEWVEETQQPEGEGVAICKVQRRGWPHPTVRRYTWAEAKAAGLTQKGPWKTHPMRMLQMRARSWALRDTLPDVLCGLQMAEEVVDYQLPARAANADTRVAPSDELDRVLDGPPPGPAADPLDAIDAEIPF